MFCGNCGFENPNNAEFCASCGSRLQAMQKGNPITKVSKKGRKKMPIIPMVVIVVVIIAGIVFLLSGRSYKKTVDKFFNALFNADVATIMELVPEDKIRYDMKQEDSDSSLSEVVGEMNEEIQDYLDTLNSFLGVGWDYSYSIVSEEDITGSDLDDLKNVYKEANVSLSAAKNLDIQFQVEVDGSIEASDTITIPVIKVARSWYIDIENMGNIWR